jgi:hypothetical protein
MFNVIVRNIWNTKMHSVGRMQSVVNMIEQAVHFEHPECI